LNFEASLQREGADELKAHPWFNGEWTHTERL
jgi:hypothetical protein